MSLSGLTEPHDDERFLDASCLPAHDWPAWTEADEVALTAVLVAGDPLQRAEPSAATIVADAEVAPVDRAMLCGLAGVDVEALDDAGLVSFAVAWTRVANHAAAQVARAVARFHARVDRGELLSASALTSAEFSAALRLGSGGADRLVATATALSTRLPDTLAAVESGEVSWPKATVLAERTAVLPPALARRIEELVLPAAPSRTPARHAEAVRRAVDRIDPAGLAERRRRAEADIALIRSHVGDGMGELFARLRSEDLDTIWTGADAWARRTKAAGDARTLDQLRVAALVRWASSFLSHGDSAICDETCDPREVVSAAATDAAAERADLASPPRAHPPRRHGRPVTVRALWDLRSLVGLDARPAELADSGATLDPDAMREMVAGGAEMRRLLIDEATGEMLDLGSRSYALPPVDDSAHAAPVELQVVVMTDDWARLQAGVDAELCAAVEAAPRPIRAMLSAPVTAAALDTTPQAYPAPAALADFVATRDRHPTNPCAGRSAASAADLDHVRPVRDGGETVRSNLTSSTRRWHRLRTIGGWSLQRLGRGWLWTSPLGRTTITGPYDYRLGP